MRETKREDVSGGQSEFDISAKDKYEEPYETAKSIAKYVDPNMNMAFETGLAWLFGLNKPGIDVRRRLQIAVLKDSYDVMTVREFACQLGGIDAIRMHQIHYRSGRLIDSATVIPYVEAKLLANMESRVFDSCRENEEFWHFYNSQDQDYTRSVLVNKHSGIVYYYCEFEMLETTLWAPVDFMTGEDPNNKEDRPEIFVQSFINNIAFPATLEEVQEYKDYRGRYNVEDFECFDAIDWTVPKWCKAGDICFFMHGKSAIVRIHRLKRQLKLNRAHYTEEEYNDLYRFLCRGEELYKKYGGKIFAIGIVADKTYHIKSAGENHWQGRIYATIGNIQLLEHPVHRDEISSFITISSAAAITPVFGEQFEHLLSIITDSNSTLPYIRCCKAVPIPLAEIDDRNWIELCNKYRREFVLEYQFRSFYVDRLLRRLGDKSSFYSECTCYKDKVKPSYVDNVIAFCGKYLPVECKISVSAEVDIKAQVHKYCKLKRLILDNEKELEAEQEKVYTDYVLVVDTEGVYLFDDNEYSISLVAELDDIKSEDDIMQLRCAIAMKLGADPDNRVKTRNNACKNSNIP